ncbi:flagellar export chaperone FlgN [Candidatus Galacturonibacter soehngenii]|uniref:Flagellar protein FliT n=1 Tax=Candidatus Galacturonatibacter soehngenii TaxID=2307010 RepID=A0A7V7QHC1_9FIRM|nr:flagellar export chaperone FlgN [Candidatus Galacturonibacter soehngenii]KAB1434326.1 flagellar protein FliT [Candidatus Galacturonibacter soehngenii]
MEQGTNYINIMKDSLQKKIIVLDKIMDVNRKQAEIIKDIKTNMADYEKTLDEKQVLIDELNLLDDGFQALYSRVEQEISVHKNEHAEEIKEMQKCIALITDKSVEIQEVEEKNRQIISQQFSLFKQEVKKFKQNKRAAGQYYDTMQKTNYISPQFLDQKK